MVVIRAAVLLASLFLAACNPAAILNATVSSDGIDVRTERYGEGPRRTLDVYRPAQPSGPVIVFLYGGTWRTGDKGMYPFVARPLAARGAIVVVPDYRVYPEVRFPGFLEDNAAAVAWAFAHAAELGGDPRSVFLIGHSAGAYNALMLGLDPAFLARAGTARERLAGVMGLAGPYDFLPSDDPDVIPVFAPLQGRPGGQPIDHVDGRNPPLLLLAGDADTTVRPRNTEILARRVAAAGGLVESRIYPGIGHIGIVTAFAPLFGRRAPVLDDVWSFIERHAGRGQRP